MRNALTIVCFLALATGLPIANVADEKYSDFDDAMSAAARYLRKNDYPSAVPPLEAAVKLAKTDAQRLRAYGYLVPAYRLEPKTEKMLEAQEFIIRHTDRRAERFLAARDVVSYAIQRGKLDDVTKRYDALLKKKPQDPAALAVLTAIYAQTKAKDSRTTALKQQLTELDRTLAREFAQRLEKEAESDMRLAAWYLKDAAAAWLEAEDKATALATAKKSAAQEPESRNKQLIQMWHEGLGDVFLAAGEPQRAIAEFEAAIASADGSSVIKDNLEKKLAQARGTAVAAKVP
jgi:tetratricopeptide (TPR) repeat protein